MRRTRIKVCGITRAEDAERAVDLGADAIGFIFVGKSPRNIDERKAVAIVRDIPSFVSCVGVFVNTDIEEVRRIVEKCGLSQVQLHGEESVEYCRQLKNWRLSLSICKAFRVKSDSTAGDLNQYREDVDSMLLDTYASGKAGGTGETFDWSIIDRLNLKKPLILAGGLTPENVAGAIKAVSPYAVDVNSGVEESPGVKNHKKLQEVFAAVSEVDRKKMK